MLSAMSVLFPVIHTVLAVAIEASVKLWKNLLLTVEISFGESYVDATNLLFKKIIPGESIKKLNQEEDFPWLKEESQQYKDVERFKWFSNGFLAVNPNNKNQIVDIRYSGIPNEIGGLWGIQLNPNKQNHEHVEFVSMRSASIERTGRPKCRTRADTGPARSTFTEPPATSSGSAWRHGHGAPPRSRSPWRAQPGARRTRRTRGS